MNFVAFPLIIEQQTFTRVRLEIVTRILFDPEDKILVSSFSIHFRHSHAALLQAPVKFFEPRLHRSILDFKRRNPGFQYGDLVLLVCWFPHKIASIFDDGLVVAASPVIGSIHGIRLPDDSQPLTNNGCRIEIPHPRLTDRLSSLWLATLKQGR
jgi:hypothetical protein